MTINPNWLIGSFLVFLDSIKKLLAENNEGEVINLMQQQSNIEIPESDEVYPLLEKSGLTRYQIYSKILDKLANNFIKKVETQNWDDAKIQNFINSNKSLFESDEFRKVIISVINKYYKRLKGPNTNIFEFLKRESWVIPECSVEVKREILSRDISLFKEYVQPAFEDYLKDAFIELMSREIRGVSIYEILDYRVNQRGVLELVNLVGDNKELFHAIPQFFRDWFREYGWTKIPTFKFDFLMAMQNAGRIQICKLEPAYHVVWYLNKGLRQGFKLEQIVEIKRILDDSQLKQYVETDYLGKHPTRHVNDVTLIIRHEKTSLLKFLTELVNLGINSRKMLQRREFYEVPFDEADIYEIFYRQLLLFMYDDKCREEEIKSCFNENPTIDDENDTGSNNDQPIFRFREPEVAILKKNELARKLFCHYLAERLDNKDTDRFRQCFTYFSLTIQKDVDDIYDYAFQTFTTIVITKHRIRALCSKRWRAVVSCFLSVANRRKIFHEFTLKLLIELASEENVQIITDSGNAEKFKLIRDWSEVLLAGVVQVVPYSEKKKFYELYKELLKRTENSLGGVFKINSKPDSLMFAILKSLSGESDSSEELTM
ncbi:1880_t:CDS:10 [Entrophospora sp. SA101]|nr:1880_t:CDS:10 [Entrophospora sp. SA101]